MLKKIFSNILRAIGIMFYFIILNLAHSTMKQERLLGDIEVFAGAFLVIGIYFFERAYKKDSGSIAITGIEFLVLSLHSLSIMHVITMFRYDFRYYLLTSSYIFSIYYVLKAIILYTKEKRDYLNSLSDIPEIVKKEEPIKKEAKKRNGEVEEIQEQKEEIETQEKKEQAEETEKERNHKHKKSKKRGKRK